MADATIPQPVASFIAKYISSLEQLEVIVLVSEAPLRTWTAREVFDLVLSSEASIANRLADFATKGVLTAVGTNGPPAYQFAPPTEEMRAAVALTVQFYRERPFQAIKAIFKPQVDPVQAFADAFRFRKE
jgi:hypothetical protein